MGLRPTLDCENEGVSAGSYGRGVLFPKRCPVCGAVGAAPCDPCARALRRLDRPIAVTGVTSCRSAFVYDEHARAVLLALKYRNRRDAVAFLATEVAALIDVVADVVTWVPTTTGRRRARGFDQAELLARAVGRRVGLPVRPLLRRLDDRPQTGRDVAERRAGLRFTVRTRWPPFASVVLIDDIGTTGASLQAAALALRGPDGPVIHARTVAWTPRVRGK